MNTKPFFLLTGLAGFLFVSCNSPLKKKSKTEVSFPQSITDQTKMEIYNTLSKQIKKGNNLHYQETITNASDLSACLILTDNFLSTKGFHKLNDIEFKRKVKEIFGFTEEQCKKDILSFYIDSYSNPRCLTVDKSDMYYWGNKKAVYHISFPQKIITTLFLIPELVDYQKEFPDIKSVEKALPLTVKLDNEITAPFSKWEDAKGLDSIQQKNRDFLVALNCYLFNDSKAYTNYLIAEAPEFINSLVKDYGYTREPIFNKYLLEKYSKAAVNPPTNDKTNALELFCDLIFTRDCNKNLVIRQEMLSYISKNSDSAHTNMLEALYYLIPDITSTDSKQRMYFLQTTTVSEKRKILAYAALAFDPYFTKYNGDPLHTGFGQNIRVPILGYTLHFDPQAKNEYEEQNYYNQPKLKELISIIEQEWDEDWLYK